MFHTHKFGKIIDGYQYCEKCGKAEPVKCIHIWNIYKEKHVFGPLSKTIPQRIIIVLQCTKCGEIEER
jgi:Fe2+ or Zn2+ uptake regulation protein